MPESSEASDSDISNICDDEMDDMEVIIPGTETEPNELCCICDEAGKDNELWYRCVECSCWNHAECTGVDSPKNYMCDSCLSKK